ncbi:hypothetical protein A2U01_0040889, partial [Trifolium medium]|nr:hypothetical protein [Trifolium medium]
MAMVLKGITTCSTEFAVIVAYLTHLLAAKPKTMRAVVRHSYQAPWGFASNHTGTYVVCTLRIQNRMAAPYKLILA